MRLIASVVLTLLLPVPGATATGAAAANDVRLAEAAMRRDTATVRTLVEQKVDVNAPGRDGTPALHWLVRVDDLETARLLIRAGADATRADRYGVTPLYLACSNGNADMIRLPAYERAEVVVDPARAFGQRNRVDDGRARGQSRRGQAAARSGGGRRYERPGISADGADGGRPRKPSRRRAAAGRTARRRQYQNENRKNAALDPAEFGPRVRARHWNRTRRSAGARVAISDSRRVVSTSLCGPRRPARFRADACGRGSGH